MKLRILGMVLLLSMSSGREAAYAQAPRPPAAALAAMNQLNFLVGKWSGEGWMEFAPGPRHTFRSTEEVEMKLDGLLLLIEGIHHARIPGQKDELKVHHAVATVTFDPGSRVLRMAAFKADGKSIQPRAEIKDGAFIWGFEDPALGQLRYTIRVNASGEWFEIGERSIDGREWKKYFEMTLSRRKEPGQK